MTSERPTNKIFCHDLVCGIFYSIQTIRIKIMESYYIESSNEQNQRHTVIKSKGVHRGLESECNFFSDSEISL